MINDTSRPLILLGTNSNLLKLLELCQEIGYAVAGIIDDDYHGQGYEDLEVICREAELAEGRSYYRDRYQFFCATNWVPDDYAVAQRNRDKRARYTGMMRQYALQPATIVSPRARVSQHARIGAGTIIDDFAVIEPRVTIGEHCIIHSHSTVGHDSTIGAGCMLQRYVGITSLVTVEERCYFGIRSAVLRSDVTIGEGTFVHPNLMLLRGTGYSETVSLAGRDLRKVYAEQTVE
jgi:UDP-3-O-[3-hydroxymyristoyl] glucosamine N-acyltransferase